MIQILQGLERLSADLSVLRDTTMWHPVDAVPYLRQLQWSVETLEAKSNKISVPKPPLDAEEVWARWKTLAFDLTRLDAREIRTLCVSPKTAMKGKLTDVLDKNSDPLKRSINLIGYVQGYFGQWRKMEDPEAVEGLIKRTLAEGNIGRKSKILGLWGQSSFFFLSKLHENSGISSSRITSLCSNRVRITALNPRLLLLELLTSMLRWRQRMSWCNATRE